MKRIYGCDKTQLKLTGKALEAYNNLSPITITEYTDRCYKVKPEYENLWDIPGDGLIWDPNIQYLAQSWEKDESELWEQLEEVPVYGVTGAIETYKLMTADELIRWLEG